MGPKTSLLSVFRKKRGKKLRKKLERKKSTRKIEMRQEKLEVAKCWVSAGPRPRNSIVLAQDAFSVLYKYEIVATSVVELNSGL